MSKKQDKSQNDLNYKSGEEPLLMKRKEGEKMMNLRKSSVTKMEFELDLE